MISRLNRQQALVRQIARLERRLATWQRHSDRYAQTRLLLFVAATLLNGATFFILGAGWWAALSLPLFIPFLAAVYAHRRLEAGLRRHQIWRRLKTTHLARLTLQWEAIPAPPPLSLPVDHPFAHDLDLIGDRSLHQLLDTAVSQQGSQRLLQWLTATAVAPALLAERRQRVAALRGQPLFRDKLILQATLAAGDDKRPGEAVLHWLHSHPASPSLRTILGLLVGLAGLNIILLLLNLLGILPAWWPVSWLLYAAVFLTQMGQTGNFFNQALRLSDSLERLYTVFRFLEQHRYGRQQTIRQLCAPFLNGNNRPSVRLAQLRRIVAGAGAQQNPFLGLLLNALLPWNYYFAYRLDQYKRQLVTQLPAWLDVWFELEALNSVAAFAYLNPDTVFPEVVGGAADRETAVFAAQQLAHPLIPAAQRVGNDFTLNGLGQVAIITGSNMAGKSSFLRAIGVNLCLAYAGGPVAAQSMTTSLFRLYTSMRLADSVTEGFSFFYAEVRRLKALLRELENERRRPLFFLIDEIFRGTNNRERLIGSRAYIRALAGGHGTGLIATHDLELVKLADEIPLIANYHFRDDVIDGRMVFDYQLRPGPCPTTNALKIMALAGLPVAPPDDKV